MLTTAGQRRVVRRGKTSAHEREEGSQEALRLTKGQTIDQPVKGGAKLDHRGGGKLDH